MPTKNASLKLRSAAGQGDTSAWEPSLGRVDAVILRGFVALDNSQVVPRWALTPSRGPPDLLILSPEVVP